MTNERVSVIGNNNDSSNRSDENENKGNNVNKNGRCEARLPNTLISSFILPLYASIVISNNLTLSCSTTMCIVITDVTVILQ